MPNRILKESICTSDSIDKLSSFEETLFYRLIVNCDDFGRFDGRPKIIASKLYPLKDIRSTQIESALRTLTSAELVILYEVDGKPFLQMKTWDRHQQIRAKKSKYPAPEDGTVKSDINCNQMISDDSKCSRNPIQSESNPNPKQLSGASAPDRAFDKFWAVYPRHEKKQDARKAFLKIKPDDELLNTMLTAVQRQKQTEQWTKDGGQFIPMPTTWLNGRRWEDEPPKPVSKPVKTVSAAQYTQRDYDEADLEERLGVNDIFRGAS